MHEAFGEVLLKAASSINKFATKQGANVRVVVQPFTEGLALSDAKLLNPVDCFYPSMEGQALLAKGLWNNMMTPSGLKATDVTPDQELVCPYESTRLWTGRQDSHLGQDSSPTFDVVSPKRGDIWSAGDLVAVRWARNADAEAAGSCTSHVRIELHYTLKKYASGGRDASNPLGQRSCPHSAPHARLRSVPTMGQQARYRRRHRHWRLIDAHAAARRRPRPKRRCLHVARAAAVSRDGQGVHGPYL